MERANDVQSGLGYQLLQGVTDKYLPGGYWLSWISNSWSDRTWTPCVKLRTRESPPIGEWGATQLASCQELWREPPASFSTNSCSSCKIIHEKENNGVSTFSAVVQNSVNIQKPISLWVWWRNWGKSTLRISVFFMSQGLAWEGRK